VKAINFKQLEVEGMHCIEIKATSFKSFKALINRNGGEVSVVSRYQDSGMRLLDVEVSKDTKAIDRIERGFSLNV